MTQAEAYYQDDTLTLWHGDASATLAMLPAGSVDSVVTSPPYFGLRDYGVDGQIGAESSPAEFTSALVAVFREARRVLADDGTFWLNLGDSYAGKANAGRAFTKNRGRNVQSVGYPAQRNMLEHAPYKGLLGMPWRVALALQDDGWILRNDIIWAKPNAMPESVKDRLANRHEHLFLLTKSANYWFDLDPIREPVRTQRPEALSWARDSKEADVPGQTMRQHRSTRDEATQPVERGRNPGDVWTIPTQPFPGAHFATMPTALAERCILAGCKPSGVVLDPFSGAGTTGLAATKHGRRYIGIDLNREYLDISLRTRLAQGVLAGGAR